MLSLETVQEIYQRPLLSLIFTAQSVHRQYHQPDRVQLCTLANIKSGHCPEDCQYCPQSRRYNTGIPTYPLLPVETVLQQAEEAKQNGSTRFCMGAAWRQVPDGEEFEAVLAMVRGVKALGMEACVTLGMVKPHQAQALAAAGLTAYNHNLDTSPEFYSQIISTRTYNDRLETIKTIAQAGIQVCCGGIIGMGESHTDRIKLLHTLANLQPQPHSVPINALVPVPGTPLAQQEPVSAFDLARMIATARIIMPHATIRLSAGRQQMSDSDQALCFLAGASSIFTGEKLLTTPNPGTDRDRALFDRLGLHPLC